MFDLDDLVSDFATHWGHRHHLPEYRQVELYSKRKTLAFAEPTVPNHRQLRGSLATEMAFVALEAYLSGQTPSIEGLPSWKKYLALPKSNRSQKLLAEVYRILRIHHLAWTQPTGHLEQHDDGLVRIACVFERCHLALTISPIGIQLLESVVLYYLDALRQPYSDAYVEAMLSQYFVDIVAEIKAFSDEDRILYQFNQGMAMNRHFRLDSDHPQFSTDEQHLIIEIGRRHADSRVFPIDFFIVVDDQLHIIPVEALNQGKLPLAQLSKWLAKLPTGEGLPDAYRYRFGREKHIVGLPMT